MNNQQTQTHNPRTERASPPRTGLYTLAFFVAFAILLIVQQAIDKGFLLQLIIGSVVALAIVVTAATAIVNKVAIPFLDTRLKYLDANLEQQRAQWNHERDMLKLQLEHRPALPAPEYHAEVEPYRQLARELVALTREKLGDQADRILSREQAESYDLFRGHKTWEHAVEFLTAYSLVYELRNGKRNEGTVINKGKTAAEVYEWFTLPARQ